MGCSEERRPKEPHGEASELGTPWGTTSIPLQAGKLPQVSPESPGERSSEDKEERWSRSDLNSKSEFNRCHIPRLVVEEEEKE